MPAARTGVLTLVRAAGVSVSEADGLVEPEVMGYQVVIEVEAPDRGLQREVLNNITRRSAEQLLRMWRRPRWLRRAGGVRMPDVCECCGEDIYYAWDEIVSIRIQPQAEAIP